MASILHQDSRPPVVEKLLFARHVRKPPWAHTSSQNLEPRVTAATATATPEAKSSRCPCSGTKKPLSLAAARPVTLVREYFFGGMGMRLSVFYPSTPLPTHPPTHEKQTADLRRYSLSRQKLKPRVATATANTVEAKSRWCPCPPPLPPPYTCFQMARVFSAQNTPTSHARAPSSRCTTYPSTQPINQKARSIGKLGLCLGRSREHQRYKWHRWRRQRWRRRLEWLGVRLDSGGGHGPPSRGVLPSA